MANSQGRGLTTPAQIFTMTQWEANTSNILGNLCIRSFNVYVLIDLGAFHYFVNLKAVLRLGLLSLQYPLLVSGQV